jgi:Lrp/AsnC family leucine-responsive transcriptional regulator
MNIDSTDMRILTELQNDSSLTNIELARRVHLSPSPCLTRVKSLEAAGVITRYVALVNPKQLGLTLSVFISISLKEQSKSARAEFEERIAEHDEVMECYLMTGDSDYLIRVAVTDISALEKFILDQLSPISGIEKTKLYKKQETEFLIEHINNQIPKVLLTKVSIIYFNWMERFEKLETPINFSLSFSYIISILSCA